MTEGSLKQWLQKDVYVEVNQARKIDSHFIVIISLIVIESTRDNPEVTCKGTLDCIDACPMRIELSIFLNDSCIMTMLSRQAKCSLSISPIRKIYFCLTYLIMVITGLKRMHKFKRFWHRFNDTIKYILETDSESKWWSYPVRTETCFMVRAGVVYCRFTARNSPIFCYRMASQIHLMTDYK